MQEEVRQLRAQVRTLERKWRERKEQLHVAEVALFKQCTHEWGKTDEGQGFWYAYCPETCLKCGYLKMGPVKLP